MAQIGTIKLQTQNGGAVEVPVYNTGDSGSGIYEMLRVQTENNGVGFVPVTDPSEATYQYLRIQTQNHGVLAVHNEVSLTKYIDDFEDTDLSEYTTPASGGSIGTTTSYTKGGGSRSLKVTNETDGTNQSATSLPGDGLSNYLDQDETMSIWVRIGGTGSEPWIGYAKQDYKERTNSYYTRLDARGTFSIRLSNSGNASTLASQSVSFSNNTWYKVEISWSTSGDHTHTLYDSSGSQIAQITANDTTFTDGGHQWLGRTNNGTQKTQHFDTAKII